MREVAFREKVADSARKMQECLTVKEQMRVAFVPLIITHCAWLYAHKAMELAARDKISILKKLSRTLKAVHQKYTDELKLDLDYDSRIRIGTQAEEFLQEITRDMTILFFSVRGELRRCAPEYPCVEQRVYAIISLLFVNLLEEFNAEMNTLLTDKMKGTGIELNATHPISLHLRTGMRAFAGVDGKFNYDNTNIVLGMKVIRNRLYEMEFEVTKA